MTNPNIKEDVQTLINHTDKLDKKLAKAFINNGEFDRGDRSIAKEYFGKELTDGLYNKTKIVSNCKINNLIDNTHKFKSVESTTIDIYHRLLSDIMLDAENIKENSVSRIKEYMDEINENIQESISEKVQNSISRQETSLISINQITNKILEKTKLGSLAEKEEMTVDTPEGPFTFKKADLEFYIGAEKNEIIYEVKRLVKDAIKEENSNFQNNVKDSIQNNIKTNLIIGTLIANATLTTFLIFFFK